MDLTQTLKDTENALRDFIANILSIAYGENWIEKCGVTPDRIVKWKERKSTEGKRQEAGVVEERLIYYADFYDLKSIIQKNWSGIFDEVFGDRKRIEFFCQNLKKCVILMLIEENFYHIKNILH